MYIVRGLTVDFNYKSFLQALRAWGRSDLELYYYSKMSGEIYIGNLKDDLNCSDLERAFSNQDLRKEMEKRSEKK
jgi:hypothetical protein